MGSCSERLVPSLRSIRRFSVASKGRKRGYGERENVHIIR